MRSSLVFAPIGGSEAVGDRIACNCKGAKEMSEPMEQKQDQRQEETSSDLSRRDFIAMATAAGVVAATDSASAAMPVMETDVMIKTSDGTCDAAFIHPTSGSY